MIRKTSSIELLKWLVWTVIAGYILGYLTVLTLDSIFVKVPKELYSFIPLFFVTVALIHFYGRQLTRLDNHLPVKEKRELKATNARSIKVNGTHRVFLSQVRSIFAEAPQSPVSVLWWQYGSYIIREDTAYEWLRKGWNRQLVGEPHPYSGNWMINQKFYTLGSQRIKRAYHDAMCSLMTEYQLWLKEPSQGTSGEMLTSPLGCIAKLQGRWDN